MIGFLVADAQHVWTRQPTQLDLRQEEADGQMYLLHAGQKANGQIVGRAHD